MPSLRRTLLPVLGCAILGCASPASAPGTPAAPAQVSPAQVSPPRIPARALQEDFAILKEAYETLHPGLYRYNTKAQMDAQFEALGAELDHDRTLPDAYLAFSIFLAKIKCGHSYPNFHNQEKAVADALFMHRDRLPYYFRWMGRRMIVTRDFSGDARLRPGTEVLSVNGVKAEVILDRLMTIARADGSNDAKRVSLLEVQGTEKYETFDVYFPLFFPPKEDRITLEVKEPLAAKSTTLDIRALTHEERLAPVKAAIEATRGDGPVWDLEFFGEHLAYLRMPTFALYNSKWDWKGFLEKTFDEIDRRGVKNLAIDLRGNEGGLDVGDFILRRLIRRRIKVDEYRRLVRYRKVSASLEPYLDTWDPSFKDWGDQAVELQGRFFRLRKFDDEGGNNEIEPSGRPFKGHTFVLVDAANSSATFQFAQVLQQNKLATLVGTPTGGNQRGINGGAFFFLRLPRSKIEVDIPLIGRFPAEEKPDAGLVPDILIEPRVDDITRGVDHARQSEGSRGAPRLRAVSASLPHESS